MCSGIPHVALKTRRFVLREQVDAGGMGVVEVGVVWLAMERLDEFRTVDGRASGPLADPHVSGLVAFSMGPLVGIALSWEAFPRAGTPLEGAAVRMDWEAPLTFQTRHTWLDLSVQEADRMLEAL